MYVDHGRWSCVGQDRHVTAKLLLLNSAFLNIVASLRIHSNNPSGGPTSVTGPAPRELSENQNSALGQGSWLLPGALGSGPLLAVLWLEDWV